MKSAGMLFTWAMVLAASTVRAEDSADGAIKEGLGRLAEKVAKFIEDQGVEKAVTVGDFVSPPRLKASGGAGISRLLEDAFKKQNIAVKGKAPFQILGQFTVRDEKANADDSFESVSLRLTASLLDSKDEELQKFAISVFGDAALQITGRNVEIPPNSNAKDVEEHKRGAVENPKAVVVGNETRATSDSPFGVEILIRRGAGGATQSRFPAIKDGFSFIELTKGEEYVVRLRNRANFETAVTLTVDGLNMFSFSEEGNFGSQIIVPPGRFIDIPGWYITRSKTDVFEIGSYAKSAAASRNVVSGIGTITASFSAAWDPEQKPPADEIAPKSADTATARGRQIEQKYEQVNRVVGRLRAVVSVRYDR